jgi:hypothetical protein
MATAAGVVFLPFRPEEKKEATQVSNKITPQMAEVLTRFTVGTENAARRQLSPGDDADGGLSGGNPPDYDDQDDADVAMAMNHLMEHNRGQPDAMSHIHAAAEALGRIVERRGKASPHSITFAARG